MEFILQILIEAGDKLGVASNNVARALVAALALCKNSEDELESDGEVRKKKPRSASLNRSTFTLIHLSHHLLN